MLNFNTNEHAEPGAVRADYADIAQRVIEILQQQHGVGARKNVTDQSGSKRSCGGPHSQPNNKEDFHQQLDQLQEELLRKTELVSCLEQQLAQAEEDLGFHKKRNRCLTQKLEEMGGQAAEVAKLQRTIEDLEDKVRLFEQLEQTLKDKAALQASLMEEKLAAQVNKNDGLVAQVNELQHTIDYLEERLRGADACPTHQEVPIVSV